MKNFLRCKSVGGGMMQLLHDYCVEQQITSPIDRPYQIDERISFEKWLKALQAIYLKHPITGLGVDIGKYIQRSHVGILGYIADSSQNLAQFFSLSSRYVSIWYNFTPIKVYQTQEDLLIHWEQPAYVKSGLYVHETAISQELLVSILWHRLAQLIPPEQVRFNWVEFAVAEPKDSKCYNIFNCPIRFQAQQTSVSFPLSMLNIPLQKPDQVLFDILYKQAKSTLASLPKDDDFIELVNQHIIAALKLQRAFIDHIADQMHISVRQLQIMLKKHGLSFQQCLNNIRSGLAKCYLKDPNLSVLDISLMLSYTEVASFNRAFKTWTGMSPSQWRQQHYSKEC